MSQPACRSIRCLLVAFALCGCGLAQATTLYKCTDAKGAVTIQNDVPCPPGSKQEVRDVRALPTAAPPPKRAEPVAAPSGPPAGARFELVRGPVTDADVLPAARLPPAERKPPPTLYECRTWDADTFLSESGEGEARCAPLNTIGVDGSAAMGAGEACEVKRDVCTALVDVPLCTAWQRRIDEAKFRMTYATGRDKESRKAEYERYLAAYVDTSCR
jgi:hypothetical protein